MVMCLLHTLKSAPITPHDAPMKMNGTNSHTIYLGNAWRPRSGKRAPSSAARGARGLAVLGHRRSKEHETRVGEHAVALVVQVVHL